MSTGTEVTRCISHLDCTELHGQEIFVERVSYHWEYGPCSFQWNPHAWRSSGHVSHTLPTMFLRPRVIHSKKKAQRRKRRINPVRSALQQESGWPSRCQKWLSIFFFFKSTVNSIFLCCRTSPSYKKEDKKLDKPSNKDKDLGKKQEAKGAKAESVSSEPESSMKDERKHWRKCLCVLVEIFFVTPLM